LRRPELETAEEKLSFLRNARIGSVSFEELRPDAKNNWLNQTSNDFDTLIPIATKEAKTAKKAGQEKAIFKLFSMGVITARDEWVYGFACDAVEDKVCHLVHIYNMDLKRLKREKRDDQWVSKLDHSIKWTRSVKRDLANGVSYKFESHAVVTSLYRPFVRKYLYFSPGLIEMPNQMPVFFPREERSFASNVVIFFNDRGSRSPFSPLAAREIAEYHLAASSDGFQGLGLYRYDQDGRRHDNITDWALAQFKKHYQPGRGKKERPITKEAIFQYVYGVLHDPIYREKYALNLKRDFPHIPFYPNFWQWAVWGKTLIDLHIGYETIKPWPLKRINVPDKSARQTGIAPKAMLKADKGTGRITLDSETTLVGVPPEAWEYRLGNRAALEWILDQYKEKKPKDPTIRSRFDTYRFADYKEHVVDLLARVTTVSMETVRITREMREVRR
jgi:predicted helicase